MEIKKTLSISVKALLKNKMRSILTTLGVIIGISSVIVMMGLGNSAREVISKQVYTIGNNAVSIETFENEISIRDAENLMKSLPGSVHYSPYVYLSSKNIRYNQNRDTSYLFGVNNAYFKIRNFKIKVGRKFKRKEIQLGDKVVIIGHAVKEKFFKNINPIGEKLLITNLPFKIIGVFEEKGAGLTNRNLDDVIVVPYTTAAKKIQGKQSFNDMFISFKSAYYMEKSELIIINYFKWKYNYKIKVVKTSDQLELAHSIADILSYLLIGVASIALFVGGVGIMNIMLVSVRERTREIGIRMAIGAKEKDILNQFLIESVLLSIIGGFIGIIFGLGIYSLVLYITNWPFIFSPISVFLSLGISSSVGIIFGYLPAKQAASLKPIDALKFE